MIKRKVVRERAKENSNAMTVAIAERRVVIIVRVGVAMIGAVDVVMIGAVDVVMIGVVGEVAKDAVLITVTGAGPGGAMMTEAVDLATGRKFRRRQDSLPK
ncbi:MAG: hypothetical protein ABGZ49_06475 [Akkermansiaceae bacterium]